MPKIGEGSLIALATNAKADPPTAEQFKKTASTLLMSGGEDAIPTLRALLRRRIQK